MFVPNMLSIRLNCYGYVCIRVGLYAHYGRTCGAFREQFLSDLLKYLSPSVCREVIRQDADFPATPDLEIWTLSAEYNANDQGRQRGEHFQTRMWEYH